MKLLLATSNQGKIKEISQFLAKIPDLEIVAASELAATRDLDPEETGLTFAENAEIKARAFASASGMAVLADDSGLCVDCLDGFPGVKTARWRTGDQSGRNSGLIELIKLRQRNQPLKISRMVDFPDVKIDLDQNKTLSSDLSTKSARKCSFFTSTANFNCTLCFFDPTQTDFQPLFFTGKFIGQIDLDHPEGRGSLGFGYDPIFIPDDFPKNTIGELGPKIKNKISHRAQALRAFANYLESIQK